VKQPQISAKQPRNRSRIGHTIAQPQPQPSTTHHIRNSTQPQTTDPTNRSTTIATTSTTARARISDQLSPLVTGRATHEEVGCIVTLHEKRDHVDGSHVMDVCMVFR
jgi:hypothetical protein